MTKTEQRIEQFKPLFALETGGGNLSASNYYQALQTANSTMRTYYMFFFNLVTNMFKWEGLPDSADATYIEDMLCLTGKCSFVNDADNGIMSPQFVSKRIDWYGRPSQIECYANEYTKQFNNKDDFVIIRNTNNYVPTFQYIDFFVQKIVKAQEVVDVNLNAQKTPVVFRGTREQREFLKELLNKYDGDAWYIFLEKDVAGSVDSLNTNAPYLVDKLNDYIRWLIDMFLTFIGLNNAGGQFKKERSLYDEINANNELIGLTCDSMLRARQKACDEYNDKFKGIVPPISVSYSEEVIKALEQVNTSNEFQLKEGDDDE